MLSSHFLLWCNDLMEIETHILYNVSFSYFSRCLSLISFFHVDAVCLPVSNYIQEEILIDFHLTLCLMCCWNGTKDDLLNNIFECFLIKSYLWISSLILSGFLCYHGCLVSHNPFRHVNATRSYLHFRQIEFSIDNENAGKNAQVKLYFMTELKVILYLWKK